MRVWYNVTLSELLDGEFVLDDDEYEAYEAADDKDDFLRRVVEDEAWDNKGTGDIEVESVEWYTDE